MAQASSSSGLHAVRIASGYSSSKVKHSVHSSRPSSSRGTKLEREGSSGCLEIIPGEGKGALFSRDIQNKQECDSRPGSAGSRPGSGSLSIGQRAPPVNRGVSAASLRTPTPTKQVKLQAVARKEIDETSFGDLDWEEYQHLEASRLKGATKSHSSSEERKTTCLRHDLEELSLAEARAPNRLGSKRPGEKATIGEMKSSAHAQCKDSNHGAERSRVPISVSGAGTGPQEAPPDGVESLQQLPQATTESELIDIEDSDQFDTDLEDGGEGGDGNSDEEPSKAPSQLLMEFLTCMMDKDYKTAHKLCTMILLYEPQHEEATKFKPLIEEKMKLEEEAANQSGSDVSSDDDSDDDDEDEETDDSSDDTDTSEEESGSDETEEGGGTQGDLRTKCAGDR